MKVFVAIDSFKGAVGSAAACRAAADALREAFALREAGGRLSAPAGSGRSAASPADVLEFPVSDGGEGFCECIHHYLGGTWIPLPVTGPDGQTVEAKYLIANGKAPANGSIFGTGDASPKTAFIESASACGYTLVSGSHPDPREHDTDSHDRHDPRELTTAGVGEMIADAISRGCTRIFLGLGGTATMDAGLGLRTALRDSFRCGIPDSIEFIACVDTFAPLTGPNGTAFMYGPQKGLRKNQLAEADAWLARQAAIFGLSPTTPGFGAAGGLLCGLASVTANLSIVSGAELLMEISGLRKAVAEALDSPDSTEDNILIITGEGRVDEQSLTGKLTGRIAAFASSLNQDSTQPINQASRLPRTKVLCLAGSIGKGFDPKSSIFDEVLVITPEGTPLDKALADTAANIRRTLLKHFSV